MKNAFDMTSVMRFMNCLRGIGKTYGMLENIRSFIDETLLFKKDFEVLVICPSVSDKRNYKTYLTDHYLKYIDLKSMHEIMYKLSEIPTDPDNPYDIPRISQFSWSFGSGSKFEKVFVDPSCFELLCRQQVDKLQHIKEMFE